MGVLQVFAWGQRTERQSVMCCLSFRWACDHFCGEFTERLLYRLRIFNPGKVRALDRAMHDIASLETRFFPSTLPNNAVICAADDQRRDRLWPPSGSVSLIEIASGPSDGKR